MAFMSSDTSGGLGRELTLPTDKFWYNISTFGSAFLLSLETFVFVGSFGAGSLVASAATAATVGGFPLYTCLGGSTPLMTQQD